MPNLKLTNLFSTLPLLSASALVLSCAANTLVYAEEETAVAKPIVKDAVPEKMKSLEMGDSLPKPKSKPSSAEARPKEEMSADDLAGKIAKKIAELHLENEKNKAQIQARRDQAKKVASTTNPIKPLREAKPGEEPAPINLRNVHWGYDGAGNPQNWAKLDPANAKCETGDRQSPIDITGGIQVDLEPVTFDYKPVRYNVVDTGQTIQVNVGAGDSISILGKRYDLTEFHFHKPAEERINGKTYDMVAHLVHKSVEGKLVEIAVLFEEGKGNGLIQTIWNNMPLEKNTAVQPTGTIDLNQILPTGRQYFTYMGSLTTPPCTEGVLWIVYKEPVQLTTEQIGIFNRMYSMNARPIQNSAGRLIKESN